MAVEYRQALRSFGKSRGLVAVVVLTIALGIGASTTMFSVVQSVLLNPLPFPEPDRLVALWPEKRWSAVMLTDVEERVDSYQSISIHTVATNILLGDGPAEAIPTGLVSASHFDVLGTQPFIGGGFIPGDAALERGPVVVLSHAFWQRQFGGDHSVVGQQIRLAGQGIVERTIVGVLPPDAEMLPSTPEIWAPIVMTAGQPGWLSYYGLSAIGRLRADITSEHARHELRGLVDELTPMHPSQFRPIRYSPVDVVPLLEQQVAAVRTQLWMLLGAACLILIIACINVANLLLARAQGRRGEVALRMALGSSRGRIARQMLTESVMLSAVGAAIGIWAAYLSMPILREFVAAQIPRSHSISVDASVLVFAVSLALISGLLSGAIPAIRAANASPSALMRAAGGRSQAGSHGANRASNSLVIGEIALCLVLLAGAGLMIKSIWQLTEVAPGFDAENILTVQFTVPPQRYDETEVREVLRREIEQAVQAIPGVESVASVDFLPMGGAGLAIPYQIEGIDFEDESSRVVNLRTITPGYFELLRTPLLEGRMLGEQDIPVETGGAALVNESFARQYWPNGGAVGNRFLNSGGEVMSTIVGVVGDQRQQRLSEPAQPEIYGSAIQFGWPNTVVLLVRGAASVPAAEVVTRAIQAVDPEIAPRNIRPMTEVVASSIDETRFYTRLLVVFAISALVLGIVGVYGVISYSVSRRIRELGVRQALGATAANLVGFVLRGAMRPVVIGVVIGLIAALALVRLLAGLVYGVHLADPAIFATVALLLLVASAAGALVPALGTVKVSPIEALRPD